MNATDLSSLDRFDTASLVRTLERRRAMRREAAAQFGRESAQHRAAVSSIWTVMVVLRGRGWAAA